MQSLNPVVKRYGQKDRHKTAIDPASGDEDSDDTRIDSTSIPVLSFVVQELLTGAIVGRSCERLLRMRVSRVLLGDETMKEQKKFEEMTILGIASDTRNMQPVVILKEKTGERELYIWIGPVEAMALQRAMNKEVFQRPLTHELLRTVLEKAELEMEHIEIDDLRDHTYYATIYLRNAGGKLISIDARPSDALVLATWTGVPVFVSEQVIEGMTRSEEETAARKKMILTQEDIEGTDEELTKILERMDPDDIGNA